MLYKEFIDKRKFYRIERSYRPYYRVVEYESIGEPYETIGDWTEELTGNAAFGYNDTYFLYLDKFITDQMPTENYEEYGEQLVEIE